jgi:sigma-B regulation protein RsbU (phosphoserine phosphatase)
VNAGLQPGDFVVSLQGKPFTRRLQLYEWLRHANAGETLRIEYRRGDQPVREARILLTEVSRDNATWLAWSVAIFSDFLTRWLCFLLAMFVVFSRPRDPLAWLVMLMLVSFSHIASGLSHIADGWSQPWKLFAVFYLTLATRTWPTWMLLFGIYFPNPQSKVRLMAWTRWVLAFPNLLASLFVAALVTWEASGMPVDSSLPLWVERYLNPISLTGMPGIGLYFANLSYKAAKELNPDAKRRLRVLFWGGNVSLTPIFLLILWSWFTRHAASDAPSGVYLGTILLLFVFPMTLAYVIVVERALDVRVVIRQGLQYALARRGVKVVTALLVFGVMWLAIETINDPSTRRPARVQTIGWSIAAVLLLQKGAGRARGWLDRRFFREQVEAEAVLEGLGEEVRHIADPAELKRRVCTRISESLHVPQVDITNNGPGDGFELAMPLTVGGKHLGHLVLGPKRSEEPYTGSDRRLLQSVATQTALALENARLTATVAQEAAHRERIHRELEIARQVQEQLFPHKPPPVEDLEYAGHCRPAQSIGGDYYDFFLTPVDDGTRLIVAEGDICGKGVPAALLMAGLQASLRGLCAGGVQDLGDLMGRLNKLVFDATPKNRFATMWCGQYDPASRLLRHVSAGHGDALIVRADGELQTGGARGLALGLVKQTAYAYSETQLHPGDLVAICTDGVTEARNRKGEEFGDDRWAETVLNSREAAPRDIIQRVIDTVDRFVDGAEQHDDITVVVLRVR